MELEKGLKEGREAVSLREVEEGPDPGTARIRSLDLINYLRSFLSFLLRR